MKTWRVVCGVVLGVFAWGTVLACGQVAPVGHAKPGATVEIRGYGYGFEGDYRSLTFRWAHDGSPAGAATIDADGNFHATIKVRDAVGLHKLIVSQGDRDPAPVEVTVPAVGPWYLQSAGLLAPIPVGIASAVLAALGILGFLVMQFLLRRKPRLAATG